jgi:hypothetical protein
VTRATETKHLKLQEEHSADRPHLYGLYWPGRDDDIVKVHRFFVPGHDDVNVLVVGVWREKQNFLLHTVRLFQLNELQTWFSWSTMWGIKIQLSAQAELTVEATLKVDRPYHESEFDRAYVAWRKKNPNATLADFSTWSHARVSQGLVECEINQCEKLAVVGSTCCIEHQKFA